MVWFWFVMLPYGIALCGVVSSVVVLCGMFSSVVVLCGPVALSYQFLGEVP